MNKMKLSIWIFSCHRNVILR